MSPARGAALLAVSAGLLAGSCVGETPPNPISAPDINKLTVFFPLDGLVNGRGSPSAVPAGYDWVFIRPHPSRNVFTFAKINKDDGSFAFRIASTGTDILEIAYAQKNEEGAPRGAPAFVEVPLQPAAGQQYYCCKNPGATSGRCQATTDTEMCFGTPTLAPCSADNDCAFLSGERLGITPADFTVTQPDAAGNITVTSHNPAYALHLMRIENRGQRAIGGRDARVREYVIAKENGEATVAMRARGDDEIVVRIFDIDGYTSSREHAMYVPDADFSGIDVVGVFPFEGLKDNNPGRIGIRIAPYGVDSRGICAPSSEPGPALCFSGGHEAPGTGQNATFNGGLDYAQVTVAATMEGGVPVRVEPPTVEEQAERNTKFTDGNVLAPPQAVALIIDHSMDANRRDGGRARFRAAENFLRSARSRDQIMVFATGTHDGMTTGTGFVQRTGLVSRAEALTNILQLEGQDTAGDNGIYGAVALAGEQLFELAREREGRVLVISATDPENDPTTYDAAIGAVTGDDRVGRPPYPTYVVNLSLVDTTIRSSYQSLPGFTLGRFSELALADDYLTAVAEVTGSIFGAYVLMYVLHVPDLGGQKTADITLDVTVRLPDPLDPINPNMSQMQTTSYTGQIELRDNVPN